MAGLQRRSFAADEQRLPLAGLVVSTTERYDDLPLTDRCGRMASPVADTFHSAGDYIRADGSIEIGRLMKGMDWGDATSNPASVHDGLCQA